jgi:uncharacterized protein YbjT (DUF2867 family)
MQETRQGVFITGGTGYIGSRLIPRLRARGHSVRALVRRGSEAKLPPGCEAVVGNALDANSYRDAVKPSETFIQLVGVAHPSPAKAAEFQRVDLVAGREAVIAAQSAGIRHFIYVSVAHPAPMMKAYIEVRAECERLIRDSGMNATILRPWYVLGPGHRWPYAILPVYWLFESIPSMREGAQRLGLVTLEQVLQALTESVDHPCTGQRILGVPEIRRGTFDSAQVTVTA